MFPLPRIIYAMAMDGLIFRFLGQVHHYFRTPLYGTLIAGLFTGLSHSLLNAVKVTVFCIHQDWDRAQLQVIILNYNIP